jgi:hypothetical protein
MPHGFGNLALAQITTLTHPSSPFKLARAASTQQLPSMRSSIVVLLPTQRLPR